MDADAAEAQLRHWRATVESRDRVVLDALAANVNIRRIHLLTGLARSTIYEIQQTAQGRRRSGEEPAAADEPTMEADRGSGLP